MVTLNGTIIVITVILALFCVDLNGVWFGWKVTRKDELRAVNKNNNFCVKQVTMFHAEVKGRGRGG